ncbi:hypothetical protein BHE74_00045979 [Ensete ventricosum]|nr:hypothetical protein BHE74_00045979 [Ensete ventricosum]
MDWRIQKLLPSPSLEASSSSPALYDITPSRLTPMRKSQSDPRNPFEIEEKKEEKKEERIWRTPLFLVIHSAAFSGALSSGPDHPPPPWTGSRPLPPTSSRSTSQLEEGNVLSVRSEGSSAKEEQQQLNEVVWHVAERGRGSFSRQIALPDNVRADQIKAHVENGVLTVVVPKEPIPPKPKPRTIAVSSKL